MKQTEVQFNMAECCDRAETLFMEESGVAKEGEKYERMRQAAFAIREEIEDRVCVRGEYAFYDRLELDGKKLTVLSPDGTVAAELECTAFEQLDVYSLEGVYAYAVTAGDYYLEDRPIMDQLYADIWGTAFTDAIRAMLVDVIREECRSTKAGLELSDSFGPGFYGMDSYEMHKMPLLVDFDCMGMEVKESGVILPQKSCAGILFRVNDKYEHLNSACELCYGSKKTCSLCSVRRHLI